jgi:hypothetical protein
MQLLLFDGVESICDALKTNNTDLTLNMVETLLQLLSLVRDIHPEKLPHITAVIEECGGLDTLEVLQNHESAEIYKVRRVHA